MSDAPRTHTVNVTLYMAQADALKLRARGVLRSLSWESNPKVPVVIEFQIQGSSRPIYVSRPSERIMSFTGPCGEPGCDGYHVIGYLPKEWDHAPDGWEPMLFDLRVNGSSLLRQDAEEVLALCVPQDRVATARDWLAKVDKLAGYEVGA